MPHAKQAQRLCVAQLVLGVFNHSAGTVRAL